ncbi:unnamed protein product [Bursaphelenchus xylophilus]|uniref:(pine wood nematode) hypothetical protein n=1 Tax=Bursaphelenchus xylophilus TaxID=6326 RepID=A0A1I7SAP8_BURXY|nr:unnamed protein product [Bursaphelenchus xylophilus]CAG9126908.1 unnamed protein product [Bursaphelenchus xylophilus]
MPLSDKLSTGTARVHPVAHDSPRHFLHDQKEIRHLEESRVKHFFKKYFLEGQRLNDKLQEKIATRGRENLPFHEKYRKYFAFLIPFCFFQLCWWSLAIRNDLFALYPTRYEMAITMILGALVSGATSEGGGAVAFPVMTLLLHIPSSVARDFSLMIQSCGMAASSFTVVYMKVKVEWHSIVFSSLGAFFSIIIGLQFLDDVIDGSQKKMVFVSIWFAFAISLLILNTQRKRITYDSIPNFGPKKALILFATGLFGGLLSAWTGSGVDICSFSMLTLLFRVSEKVATPTSVILMCLNTWVGFYWRQLMQKDVSQLAWEYFSVSVPVASTCSPIGALLSSHLHRQVLASFVYILETTALIGFLITRPAWYLIVIGFGIIAVAVLFFLIISRVGREMSDRIEDEKTQQMSPPTASTDSTIFTVEPAA